MVVAALASGLVVIAVAGLPVYVFPAVDEMVPGDVAYVIGPPTEQRVALAEQLKGAGVVDEILVSVPASGGQSARELSVCARTGVTCATPAPLTTKGEMALLTDYARTHPAERIIVITFAPHVARTRFILDKCFSGDAIVVAVDQPLRLDEWAYQYLYQTAAFAKAIVTPCVNGFDL